MRLYNPICIGSAFCTVPLKTSAGCVHRTSCADPSPTTLLGASAHLASSSLAFHPLSRHFLTSAPCHAAACVGLSPCCYRCSLPKSVLEIACSPSRASAPSRCGRPSQIMWSMERLCTRVYEGGSKCRASRKTSLCRLHITVWVRRRTNLSDGHGTKRLSSGSDDTILEQQANVTFPTGPATRIYACGLAKSARRTARSCPARSARPTARPWSRKTTTKEM